VVALGRKTLENTINMVNSNSKWKAEVVYGDTDSLFILVKGRSIDQAIQLGYEIAQSASDFNPNPVQLKFEKVK
jgi:DNA polymerase zeta